MRSLFEQMCDAVVKVRDALTGWDSYDGTVPTNIQLQDALQWGWKRLDETGKAVVVKELERMASWLRKNGRKLEDFHAVVDGLELDRHLKALPFPEVRRMVQEYNREQTLSRHAASSQTHEQRRVSSSPEEKAIETSLKKLKFDLGKLSPGNVQDKEKTMRAFNYLQETINEQSEYLLDREIKELELELDRLVGWIEKHGRTYDDFARLLMGSQRDVHRGSITFPQLAWMLKSQREDTEKPLPWLTPTSHSLTTRDRHSILSSRQQVVYGQSF